jgi:hypothetical protein
MKTYCLKSFALLTGLLIFNETVFSQSKVEISGGFGIPEYLNLKVKYGSNIQIALCQSIMPSYTDWPAAIEIYYHFGGKSKFVDQRPWYLLCGFGDLWRLNEIKYFYPKLGRSFNFSKTVGINIDVGVFYINPSNWHNEPSVNISLYIRL